MFRFKYKAYDNFWKWPMGISLGLGITMILSGFAGGYGEVVGIIGIVILCLFPVFAFLNWLNKY